MMNTAQKVVVVLGPKRPIALGMTTWHKKNFGITQAGGFASAWSDATGLGHDLLQATAELQPSVSAVGTITCDGIAQFMQSAAYTRNQPRTLYLRFKQLTWTNQDAIVTGRGTNELIVMQYTSTPSVLAYAGTLSPLNAAAPIGEWASCAVVFNGASSVLRIGATKVTGNFGAGVGTGLTLGRNGAATQYSNVEIAEIIDYAGAHTDEQQDKNIAYLNTK